MKKYLVILNHVITAEHWVYAENEKEAERLAREQTIDDCSWTETEKQLEDILEDK